MTARLTRAELDWHARSLEQRVRELEAELAAAQQDETRFERTEYTETCTLCSGSGHHRTGMLCPACLGTGIMRVVRWTPQTEGQS